MIERIRLLCKQRGTSFSKLEQTLGFANGSIAKSDEKIQSCRLKAIADYFDVSMEYLLTGINDNRFTLTEEEKELVSVYRNLTEDQKNLIRSMLNLKKGESLSLVETA